MSLQVVFFLFLTSAFFSRQSRQINIATTWARNGASFTTILCCCGNLRVNRDIGAVEIFTTQGIETIVGHAISSWRLVRYSVIFNSVHHHNFFKSFPQFLLNKLKSKLLRLRSNERLPSFIRRVFHLNEILRNFWGLKLRHAPLDSLEYFW